MTVPAYVFLALLVLATLALIGAVLRIVQLGWRAADLTVKVCELESEIASLRSQAEMREKKDHLEGLSNADAVADFDDHAIDPVLFDDTGGG